MDRGETPVTVFRLSKSTPPRADHLEVVRDGEMTLDEAEDYAERNESLDNPYNYVILDADGRLL